METVVLDGQSLFDIAIQEAGSIESVFDIAVANNISITDMLQAGQILIKGKVLNVSVAEYYRMKNIKPATDIGLYENNDGIDYMAVGIDFIVT